MPPRSSAPAQLRSGPADRPGAADVPRAGDQRCHRRRVRRTARNRSAYRARLRRRGSAPGPTEPLRELRVDSAQ